LNRWAKAAYSPAINVKGERRGEQGTEAVEPGSQEAQAEKERSRETSRHQATNDKNLRILGRAGLAESGEQLAFIAVGGIDKEPPC
jgi:hypothetical protein